jgi:hypothetical protein
MKGDFTRNSFDSAKQYSQVLMQQGRVQLDADWNEQSAIQLNYLRSFIRDLVGPAWAVGDGFSVTAVDDNPNVKNDLAFAPGRMYVDGIACDTGPVARFSAQPGAALADLKWNAKLSYLVYLDVWEQLVTWAQDPALREVALGGADTTVRTRVAWQVRLASFEGANATGNRCGEGRAELDKVLARTGKPLLAAWAFKDKDDGHCQVNPDSAYRGPENQLYRVEIHDPGSVGGADKPTFKWSRDNGSQIFPLAKPLMGEGTGTLTATLAENGRDAESALAKDDWVELVTDAYEHQNGHAALLKVSAIDPDEMTVTLTGDTTLATGAPHYAYLRRWDQRRGANANGVIEVREKGAEGADLALENGITVQFQPGGDYRTGDYWLIPARTATGDILWPAANVDGTPAAVEPHGEPHHYALLGILSLTAATKKWTVANCRCALPANLLVCPA